MALWPGSSVPLNTTYLWREEERINVMASGKLVEVGKGSQKHYMQRQGGKGQRPGVGRWLH